ncbi:outer membrane efflux family protein [Burkholderia sp. MSHR3999]|uniref:TolC family protein n=1 Tax=Burkholderia sp. MSHR3999 TaxID=1542965 RepID=UPI0005B6C68A|nr:TolC family protein [Burkholderia sp. MSHR3999]KIP16099.1 outer membrane efflux family protein [Burkholderia sp. MSHR3999]
MSARSARPRQLALAVTTAVGIGMAVQPALAGSLRGIPDILDDPLLTRPPVLDTGALLPGDSTTVACPAVAVVPSPLHLADAVDIALCHDPKVKTAWASIRLQAATLGEARAAYLPTVTGSVNGQHNDTRYPAFASANSSVRGYSSYAALNWRLFDFGGRAANRVAANDLLAAALASYDASLQGTLEATVQAYFDALTAEAAFRARAQAARFANETQVAAQRREARGATGRSDTLQAQTAFARAQLGEERARGDVRKAIAMLVYALGMPAETQLTLPAENLVPAKQDIADLAQWLQAARERHPGLEAARLRWRAAQEKVSSVRSEGLPTLDFGVSFYQNGYPNQGVQAMRSNTAIVGVTLTIPLFEGFSRTYKVREAQAQAEQSEAQMQDTERDILGAIVKAHADAESSLASLDTADTLLATAQTALESSRNRYEHGVADILEVLNAQSALADAQQERIRVQSEWRSARLRLMADAGVLGRASIVETDTFLRSDNHAKLQP